MGRKSKKMNKKNMELIGYYANPTAEDIDRIAGDIECHNNRKDREKTLSEGFTEIGRITKDTSREEEARILARATYGHEPNSEEIAAMLKALDRADREYDKRKQKRDEKKKQRKSAKEFLGKYGFSFRDFIGKTDEEINSIAESLILKEYGAEKEAPFRAKAKSDLIEQIHKELYAINDRKNRR